MIQIGEGEIVMLQKLHHQDSSALDIPIELWVNSCPKERLKGLNKNRKPAESYYVINIPIYKGGD